MSETIESLILESKALKARIAENAKELWVKKFTEFMRKHPNVKLILWTQGTPSWNDGDACTFFVSEPDYVLESEFQAAQEGAVQEGIEALTIEDICNLEEFYDYIDSEERDNSSVDKDFEELCDLFAKSKDILQSAFGDSVLVKITQSEIKIEYYSYE